MTAAVLAPLTGIRRRLDTATFLTLYVVLILLVPSDLVVGALGAAGSPAQLLGLGFALALLAWRALGHWHGGPGSTPITVAAFAFATCVLVSYAYATVRPIGTTELSSADRGLLTIIAWFGVMFMGLGGGLTRDRLDVLLRRLVAAAGAVAVLGILQFFTGEVIVDRIAIPGLTANHSIGGVTERGGFTRPAGTASHPIEFGVVMTMILPIALHYAMDRDSGRSWIARWWPIAAIALAVPQSLSRSAIVCVVVGLACIMPGWTSRQRRIGLASIVALCAALYVTVPGILGTITRLFTGISGDGSTASRTDSYGLAFEFVDKAPFFGRGLFTFLPTYRILDNQYLGLLIEVGVLGLLTLLALFVTTVLVGIRTTQTAVDARARSLSRALTATVVVAVVGFATFDAFGFPMVPGLLFLVIGLVGGASGSLRQPVKTSAPAA